MGSIMQKACFVIRQGAELVLIGIPDHGVNRCAVMLGVSYLRPQAWLDVVGP